VDAALLNKDPHLAMGCRVCHQGNGDAQEKEEAHKGMVKRPSDDLGTCGKCHGKIAATYGKSLHYTTMGQRHGVIGRFSKKETAIFDQQVFEQSCRSCHASCGDCHVKSPMVSGICLGLIAGHKFVKKNEGKTCAFCHGGRVYPEYTGDYGGSTDVHYQKGMMCVECHKVIELHGDGQPSMTKQDVKQRPQCVGCHDPLKSDKVRTRVAHGVHKDKVSCQACHAAGQYRDCQSCHLGAGATSRPAFTLGKNPRNPKEVTTLRLIPTVRDTFAKAGITMENFDALPNYWNTPPHTIRKRTDRTRNCGACHADRTNFLTGEMLVKDGSKANGGLIVVPRSINP
jgi:hypothetical protein